MKRVILEILSLRLLKLVDTKLIVADPGGRAVQGFGLWPFACWDCGFESSREHGCLSVVSVVCCQVEVSAAGLSLLQRSPTDCGASEYELET